jgi:hypothetical protein
MTSLLNVPQRQHTMQLPNRHTAEVVDPACLPLSTAQQPAGTAAGNHSPFRGPQRSWPQANSATLQAGATQLLCRHPAESVLLALLLDACPPHPQHMVGWTRGEEVRTTVLLACSSLRACHQQLLRGIPAAAGHISCLPALHRNHLHRGL